MLTIAIDGPAGAGKSTIARAVAGELGCVYVDTGALYRAIGLFALTKDIAPDDAAALVPLLGEVVVELVYRDNKQCVLLGGRDVSEEIRRPEMGMAASHVSAIPEVRAFLLEMQRDIARRCDVVMDGRDIGTVVLPKAGVKIFLTASPEARARRRYAEHLAKGQKVSYNEVLEAISQRDEQDMSRAVAPLRQAGDALLADTSELDLAESVRLVLDIVRQRELWDLLRLHLGVDDLQVLEHTIRVVGLCERFLGRAARDLGLNAELLIQASILHDIAKYDGGEHQTRSAVENAVAIAAERQKGGEADMLVQLGSIFDIIEAHTGCFHPHLHTLEAAVLRICDKLDKFHKMQDDAADKSRKSMMEITRYLKTNAPDKLEAFINVSNDIAKPYGLYFDCTQPDFYV